MTGTDNGAGRAGSNLTPEEMSAGIQVTEALGSINRIASKPPYWCRLLFHLIRGWRPSTCIEMGTAVGISAAYQAAALKLNGSGRLTTLEGAEGLAAVARRNFRNLGLDTVEVRIGRFQDTLPVLPMVRAEPRRYCLITTPIGSVGTTREARPGTGGHEVHPRARRPFVRPGASRIYYLDDRARMQITTASPGSTRGFGTAGRAVRSQRC
jgi:hypothetical protein